jgi:hypothetical protein
MISAALAVLAGGCGGGFDISSSANGTSVSRVNDELTVRVSDGPVTEGSGNLAGEQRSVAAFHKLAAYHGIHVVIDEMAADSLAIKADDNVLPLVETSVEGGTLHVRVKGNLKTHNPIRVTVDAKQLSNVRASSSAKITATKFSDDLIHVQADSSGEVSSDDVQGKEIRFAASSSGGIVAKHIEGKMLRVTASSSGRVAVAGKVDEQQVEVSSSGNYDAGQLVSRLARIACSSAGSAFVQATDEVVGSATSAGSVRYAGDPAKVSVTTISAGSVSKATR